MKLNANLYFKYHEEYECASCQKYLRVRLAESRSMVCEQCGTHYTIEPNLLRIDDYRILEVQNKFFKPTYLYELKVGMVINLKKTDFTIVGFAQKNDGSYAWDEYYLHNPKTGYRFLTVYNGHWIFLKEIDYSKPPSSYADTVYFENQDYRIFNKYESEVTAASGEFPVDLKQIKSFQVMEFIAPPQMITVEFKKDECHGFLGEYLPLEELQAAVGANIILPEPYGVGAIEPQSFTFNFLDTFKIGAIALLIAFFITIVLHTDSKNVFEETFVIQPPDSTSFNQNKHFITKSFELKGGRKNIEITLKSPVDNTWFETGIVLINDKTGEEYEFELGVEYYHGYEGGENWTEGGTESATVLSAIPAGKYHLDILPSFEKQFLNPITVDGTVSYAYTNKAPNEFTIKVARNITEWGNLIFIIILLAVFPVIQYVRENNFERNRWSQSDFSPYYVEQEEEGSIFS
jgi:hypothetical protein